ncbi:thiamine pyrophosphate-binding protein, partial [Escherichia sp. HC-TM1]
MAKMRAVDAAMYVLEKEGITTAFGVPGAAINPFYSAMRKHGGIRHILARHVEGASHMAEGYTRATAGNICRRERCSKSALASNGVMASGLPTKRRVSCELEFSACNAAGTVTEGPKSPPMTSNARVRRVKVSSPPGLV